VEGGGLLRHPQLRRRRRPWKAWILRSIVGIRPKSVWTHFREPGLGSKPTTHLYFSLFSRQSNTEQQQ
jgi:hypothetical protein